MSDTQFKAGDVVTLKSGGPVITIEDIDVYGNNNHKTAKCVWFDGKKRMTALFELHSLKPAV
jgi:uncharacterized protein YodC (DUF2158 family)